MSNDYIKTKKRPSSCELGRSLGVLLTLCITKIISHSIFKINHGL